MSDVRQKIGIVGLGYVGLPVAVGFSKKYDVIGFDINKDKIESLNRNNDPTGQFSEQTLKKASIEFVSDAEALRKCNFIIVTVPTPITKSKEPDLTYLKRASFTIGENLSRETTIIYESTVFPGTTEDICIPILEETANMTAGVDFYVGYSPERINPGDREHTFQTTTKIVSGQNDEILNRIFLLYKSVINADIYKAPSIQVAEAAKLIENVQRDINIAFMNELTLIFHKLNIETYEVLEAAKTKWNFIPMSPGLVGGHCIGIDPYYLIYKSKEKGYNPKFLTIAREINDFMPEYIIQSLLKLIVLHKFDVENIRITVLGTAFKENISDIRNSKALEIVDHVSRLGLTVQVCDPHTPHTTLKNKKNVNVQKFNELKKSDIVILAVPHREFLVDDFNGIKKLFKEEKAVLMDLMGVVPKETIADHVFIWQL